MRAHLEDGAAPPSSVSPEYQKTPTQCFPAAPCSVSLFGSRNSCACADLLFLFLFTIHSFIFFPPIYCLTVWLSATDLTLLTAVMLAAALPLCVPGAPLKDASTDLPPVEISGDEEEKVQSTTNQPDTLNSLMDTWKQVLASTKRHKNEVRSLFSYLILFNPFQTSYWLQLVFCCFFAKINLISVMSLFLVSVWGWIPWQRCVPLIELQQMPKCSSWMQTVQLQQGGSDPLPFLFWWSNKAEI